ncbi:MAG: 16S rRNA (uracil(1498)-N(3))-methyltransferase [Betaproteobacteria bacterium]|nr:16S rRNA (uracil(1498)-N(3))-methyltransferase [Betaproteobacteria bacterium]
MSARFFASLSLHAAAKGDGVVHLEGSPAMHIHVLRLQVGDVITLFDGEGGEFEAEIITIGKRLVGVKLIRHLDVERESFFPVTLVQALATGDKMDWIVQKAVELGVHSIQPIQVERSTVRLASERADKRVQHWQAIAISACEQCGRNRVPMVHPVADFQAWLTRPATDLRLMLHPDAPSSLMSFQPLKAASAVSLIIGPEGGFSDVELQRAHAARIAAVRLGLRILRTETAGIAVLSALQAVWGDLA